MPPNPHDLPEPWRSKALHKPPLWMRVRTVAIAVGSYAAFIWLLVDATRRVWGG